MVVATGPLPTITLAEAEAMVVVGVSVVLGEIKCPSSEPISRSSNSVCCFSSGKV